MYCLKAWLLIKADYEKDLTLNLKRIGVNSTIKGVNR